MFTKLVVPSIVFVASLVSLGAQSGRPASTAQPSVKLQAGETAVPGECLSKEELDLNQRLHARTTSLGSGTSTAWCPTHRSDRQVR